MGNFRSRDHSFLGTVVPWTFRSKELSFPGLFVPRNFRSATTILQSISYEPQTAVTTQNFFVVGLVLFVFPKHTQYRVSLCVRVVFFR